MLFILFFFINNNRLFDAALITVSIKKIRIN